MGRTVKKDIKALLEERDSENVREQLQNLPEEDGIDYEEIPPLSEEQLSRMKPVKNRFAKLVSKPPRSKKVSIRFEVQVLERIKEDAAELGKPYQTHINDILRTYVAEQEG